MKTNQHGSKPLHREFSCSIDSTYSDYLWQWHIGNIYGSSSHSTWLKASWKCPYKPCTVRHMPQEWAALGYLRASCWRWEELPTLGSGYLHPIILLAISGSAVLLHTDSHSPQAALSTLTLLNLVGWVHTLQTNETLWKSTTQLVVFSVVLIWFQGCTMSWFNTSVSNLNRNFQTNIVNSASKTQDFEGSALAGWM